MSKETNVERAKLAEQAERYDDMAKVSLQAGGEAGDPEGKPHSRSVSTPGFIPNANNAVFYIESTLFFAVDEAGNGERERAIE